MLGQLSGLERQERERELASQVSSLQVDRRIAHQALLEREAVIHLEFYNQMQKEVADFSETHGINLVLRVETTAINPKDPQTVIKGVSNPIVWLDNAVDITWIITRRMNDRYEAEKESQSSLPEPPEAE